MWCVRSWLTMCALALALAGCGASSSTTGRTTARSPGQPSSASASITAPAGLLVPSTPPPADVVRAGGSRLVEFERGRIVLAESGCLACHRIGTYGNRGPGPDLTRTGARLSPRRIERAIIHAAAPMPSFAHLPRAKLHALVEFLSLLRQ